MASSPCSPMLAATGLLAGLLTGLLIGVSAAAQTAAPAAPPAVGAAPTAPAPAAASGAYVSGLHPDRRPDDAPLISAEPELPQAALDQRLTGVADPKPANVVEAAKTGQWFVPLRKPGMHFPYDPRGWHSATPVSQ